MKDHNPPKVFIHTKMYEGYCRRATTRYSCLAPASLSFNNNQYIVKVLNISHGGCKFAGTQNVNTQGTISLTFYRPCDDNEFKECIPIHGRVIHVHKKKSLYIVNIDFKGILFHEHGVQDIIDESERKESKNIS